jgi:prepilin-type N-terminal cleavage/methylation domain-containing protein
MTRSKRNGFTLIELLVVITIIGILAAIALPNYIKAKDKAKEAEVKSACHTIQIALERYATDFSGKYPKQIYGGDRRGWSTELIDGYPYGCFAVAIPAAAQNGQDPPQDPLIFYAYMESYPDNAFIDPGEGRTSVITWTGASTTLGYGDPRFGYTGEVMGNCLNDPRYLWDDYGQLSNERYMIYDWSETQDSWIGMINSYTPNNPFYSMGGLPQWVRLQGSSGQAISDVESGQTINAFWAGEFFYRSGGDFFFVNAASVQDQNLQYIWDFPYMRVNRYLLGGYGSPRTQGVDVIRITEEDGQHADNLSGATIGGSEYVTHQEFCDDDGAEFFTIRLSTPEVFGGGSFGTCPTFPYWQEYNREWQYGAPDGFKDGIVITLISGSDSQKFD